MKTRLLALIFVLLPVLLCAQEIEYRFTNGAKMGFPEIGLACREPIVRPGAQAMVDPTLALFVFGPRVELGTEELTIIFPAPMFVAFAHLEITPFDDVWLYIDDPASPSKDIVRYDNGPFRVGFISVETESVQVKVKAGGITMDNRFIFETKTLDVHSFKLSTVSSDITSTVSAGGATIKLEREKATLKAGAIPPTEKLLNRTQTASLTLTRQIQLKVDNDKVTGILNNKMIPIRIFAGLYNGSEEVMTEGPRPLLPIPGIDIVIARVSKIVEVQNIQGLPPLVQPVFELVNALGNQQQNFRFRYTDAEASMQFGAVGTISFTIQASAFAQPGYTAFAFVTFKYNFVEEAECPF